MYNLLQTHSLWTSTAKDTAQNRSPNRNQQFSANPHFPQNAGTLCRFFQNMANTPFLMTLALCILTIDTGLADVSYRNAAFIAHVLQQQVN